MTGSRVVLVLAGEEFLAERAVEQLVGEVSAQGEPAEVVTLVGGEFEPDALVEAFTPSLFGGSRVVVVRDASACDKALHEPLLGYAQDLPEETTLVVTHPGGAKGKTLVDRLRAHARVVECPPVKWPSERLAFVEAEARRAGGSLSGNAAAAVIEAVGTDLRELASAVSQLVADTPGQIDEGVVRRYYRGRAGATGFAIADKAVEGDAAGALELLRWGLAVGLAPVLVTSALASSVRSIARVAGAGRGPADQLARQLGLPAWKVDKVRGQAKGWRPDGLATALLAVAEADALVKGGGDPHYAVERLVLAVTAARRR